MTGVSTKPLKIYSPMGENPDEKALAQIQMVMQDDRAVAGALMADHHLGYSMPIGGVVAYDGAISPSGVGFDIACGNKAVETPIRAVDLLHHGAVGMLMDDIESKISFGMGRVNDTPIDHELFDRHADTLRELDKLAGRKQKLSDKARAQLGTVGSGNHYVDVLTDFDTGNVWIACHFGSRGLGHTIASGFLNMARNHPFDHRGKEREEATVLDADSELGAFYVEAMKLAGDYAYAGRDYVIDTVLGILDTKPVQEVHVHHNYAWLENGLWVIRKGATPIFPDQLGFIGGSMGEGAAIVRRKPGELFDRMAYSDLGSAPHGAGRVMSRTAAAGKVKRRTMYGCTMRDCDVAITPQEHDVAIRQVEDPAYGIRCPIHDKKLRRFTKMERVSEGVIDWPAVQEQLADRGITIRGAGADEAPGVYKNLRSVLAAHEAVEIVHWLEPLGVVMAGADVFDPYKD